MGALHFECELPNIKKSQIGTCELSVEKIKLLLYFTDYVYFENSSSNPHLIRRIEELNKVYTECS